MSKEIMNTELVRLKKELDSAQVDAFYSECLKPITEADFKHNQSLTDNIQTLKTQINTLENELQ